MNNIIQKVLDELQKESPRIDYIIGMLETVLELEKSQAKKVDGVVGGIIGIGAATPNPMLASNIPMNGLESKDESAILDATARAAIEQVKILSEQSTQ